MPLQKVGINFSGLDNITEPPTFDLGNTSQEILNNIPLKANEATGGWWGLISLSALFTFLLWKLNQEQGEGGDYGYGTVRSVGIGASICSIIGLYALNIGYFSNFYHVVIFIVIAFISVGVAYKTE